MGKLIIHRHDYFYGNYYKLSVWIDGEKIAKLNPGESFEIELPEGKHTIQTSCIHFYRSPKNEISIQKDEKLNYYTALKEDSNGTIRFGLYQLIDFKSFLVLQDRPYKPADNRSIYSQPSFFRSWFYATMLFLLIAGSMITLWMHTPEENGLYFIALIALLSYAINLLYLWPKKNMVKAINRMEHFIDFHAAALLTFIVLLFHHEIPHTATMIVMGVSIVLFILFGIKHFLSKKQPDFS